MPYEEVKCNALPGLSTHSKFLARQKYWDVTDIVVQLGPVPGKESSRNPSRSNGASATRHSRRLRKKQGDRRKITVRKGTSVREMKVQVRLALWGGSVAASCRDAMCFTMHFMLMGVYSGCGTDLRGIRNPYNLPETLPPWRGT